MSDEPPPKRSKKEAKEAAARSPLTLLRKRLYGLLGDLDALGQGSREALAALRTEAVAVHGALSALTISADVACSLLCLFARLDGSLEECAELHLLAERLFDGALGAAEGAPENALSALLTVLVRQQRLADADARLAAWRAVDPPARTKLLRLRTLSPLIAGHARAGGEHLPVALALLRQLTDELNVDPSEAELAPVLRALAAAGDAEGFRAKVREMSEYVLQVQPETEAVLRFGLAREGGWRLTSGARVSVEGSCSGCGGTLRSLDVTPAQSDTLKAEVDNLVSASAAHALGSWNEFKGWLGRLAANQFTAVVDGANVAYFKQNHASGGFNFDQIRAVVAALRACGHRPLVVLHERHVYQRRRRDAPRDAPRLPKPNLSAAVRAMLDGWLSEGMLLTCEPGNNDDWYWLYTMLTLGGETILVSNDQMRDHRYNMLCRLTKRTFMRWRERHQTNFDLGWYVQPAPGTSALGDGGGRRLSRYRDPEEQQAEGGGRIWVVIAQPSVFSRSLQTDEASWHAPLAGSADWLCASRVAAAAGAGAGAADDDDDDDDDL